MLDKIAIADNVIRIAKYAIVYEESFGEEEEPQKIRELAFNETQKDKITGGLEKRGIEFKVEEVNVTPEIVQYDGMAWDKGRDAFIALINNEPSAVIKHLKDKLTSMDYKTSKYADGDYTHEEWNQIVAERKELRRQIRALEEELANENQGTN